MRPSDPVARRLTALAMTCLSLVGPCFALFGAAPARAQMVEHKAERTAEDVSLEALLNQKVSAASKHEQTAREAPASVTVITSEEIRRFGYRSLDEVLETVRGFYLNNDLDVPSLGVRGFGRPGDYNNRMLVLVDGHPANESATNWALIDVRLGTSIDLIERVEIVRGPGSALYGTGAMMAVVNVVTKDAADAPGSLLSGSAGSFGFREGRVASAKTLGERRAVSGSLAWGHGDGRNIYFRELDAAAFNGGVAERQDWKDYLNLTLNGRLGDFVIRGSHVSYSSGFPTSTIQTAFNHDAARQNFRIGRIETIYRRPVGTSRHLSLSAHFNGALRAQTLPTPIDEAVAIVEDDGRGTWSGLVAEFRWDVSPINRIISGGEVKNSVVRYKKWMEDVTLQDTTHHLSSASAFVQNEHSLGKQVTATMGMRYDYYSQSGSALSPRLGLVYSPSRASAVKALYGHAFRSPSIVELHWQQPEINFIENPNLKPEMIRSLELVWEQQLAAHSASSVSVYGYTMDDLIDIAYDPATQIIQYRNTGAVNAIGAELELRTRRPSGLLAYGSYAYQRARHSDTGERLISSPDHVLKGGISVPVADVMSGGAEVRHESDRATVFRTRTASYWLVDLVLHSEPFWFDRVEISARVRNALDADYMLPGRPDQRQLAIIQPGRRFVIEARYRF